MTKTLKCFLCLHFWGLSLYTAILVQFIRSIDIYDENLKMFKTVCVYFRFRLQVTGEWRRGSVTCQEVYSWMDQSFQGFSGISVSICDDFLRLGVTLGTICDFLTVTSLNEAKTKWCIRQGKDELVYLIDRAKMYLCISQFIRAAARE